MLVLELILGAYLVLVLGFCVLFGYVAWKTDPHPPEAAEAPTSVDEHFKTAPREQRLTAAEADRLVEQFNWSRYETWLKEPS